MKNIIKNIKIILVMKMNMVYHNNIMYIDLIGDVDIKELESKLKSFKDCYPTLDIIINKEEAFNFTNYKSNKFKKMSKRIIIN